MIFIEFRLLRIVLKNLIRIVRVSIISLFLAPLQPRLQVQQRLSITLIRDNHSLPSRIARKIGFLSKLQPSVPQSIHYPVLTCSSGSTIYRIDIPSGSVMDTVILEDIAHGECELVAMDANQYGTIVALIQRNGSFAMVECLATQGSGKATGTVIELPADCV